MTDSLGHLHIEGTRFKDQCWHLGAYEYSGEPPSPSDPKDMFVSMRTMFYGRVLVANLSRQVVEIIRESERLGALRSVGGSLESHQWELEFLPPTPNPFNPPSPGARIGEHAEFHRVLSPARFLQQANHLDRRGHTDAALDIVFEQIDELLLDGEFAQVDRLLSDIVPAAYSADLLLGILTITLPAKHRLSQRQMFYQQVEQALVQRDEMEDGLLVGLE